MGNTRYQTSTLTQYDWIWVGNQTGIDLYKRHSDSLIAERRVISLDYRFALETEFQIYQFRSNNNFGLVEVYQVDQVEEEQKSQGSLSKCGCSESKKLNVYSERIEYRLSDLPQLTFAESLCILKEILSPFYQVYQKFGPLHVNSQLIGINDKNKVKVWINQNWALNHPSYKIPVFLTINNLHLPPQLRNQREMVMNIIQVVEQKTQQGRFPLQFGEGIYANSVNFRYAKHFLAKYINEDYKDYIPAIIKRSTVLASQLQINQYNSTLPHPQKLDSSFTENTSIRIVESMYQHNKVNNKIPLETKLSSTYVPIQVSNYHLRKNTQNTLLSNNIYGSTLQQLNPQRFPIISNRVLNFSQIHDNPSNLQTNSSPTLSISHQQNSSPNFSYLKFKLIQESSIPQKVQQLLVQNKAHFEKLKTSHQFAPQAQNSQVIKPLTHSELSESSEHKASYKIIDKMDYGQVPKVR